MYLKINMAAYKKLFKLYTPLINNVNFFLTRFNPMVCHQPCATASVRLMEQKYGIPLRPKRPLNPFLKFSKQERIKVTEDYPKMPYSQILVKLSERWANCDDKLKQSLQQTYKLEMEDYVKQMLEYERNLTDNERQLIKRIRDKKLQVTQKTQMKKKLLDLGRPKKPPTGFITFLISKLSGKSKDTEYFTWLRAVSEEWTQMPQDEKNKYLNESRKLMEHYKSNLFNWEEKMVKLGHIDLVRRQVLLELKNKTTS